MKKVGIILMETSDASSGKGVEVKKETVRYEKTVCISH